MIPVLHFISNCFNVFGGLETCVPLWNAGFTLVTEAQEHVCIYPADTGWKSCYLNAWSCVNGKHQDISMKKIMDRNHPCVSNSGSPFSLIMCKAHFHIEIRLHSKHGGGLGAMALSPTQCVC